MGKNSQRRKERHAAKRKEKRKKQEQAKARREARGGGPEIYVGSHERHRRRLAESVPKSWQVEQAEDRAIFDDHALASLSSELASQARYVREALQAVLESRGEETLKRLAEIPRSSPFGEWRLFVRGLVSWLADDPKAAGESWMRLDPERRPGRIATTMMVALRTDLEGASPTAGQPASTHARGDQAETPVWQRFDAQQLSSARLLRRVRFDRLALSVAAAGLNVPEDIEGVQLGLEKLRWLQQFVAEYRDTEPELVAALEQAALRRVFAQDYSDLFDDAARTLKGPRHDPGNRLLSFFYYTQFTGDRTADVRSKRLFSTYLNEDLPRNESLSPLLRSAITALLHFGEAMALMRPATTGLIGRLFVESEDEKAIRDHLAAAVKAMPSYSPFYKAHAEWIKGKLDDDGIKKTRRKFLETEHQAVMERWSKGVPDDVTPRLWLVDQLLEEEKLEEARPHVEFLAASRQDDPRVRAMPWKWQLLEAMRLCRRKVWLPEAPARLDQAESLWPNWLSRQWLPYLRAAWLLRMRKVEEFEAAREQIARETGRTRDSLADACLMLAAVQKMRGTAPELKPFRDAVDQALQKLKTLPMDDLLDTAGFFWDMKRVELLYPAYRMHGKVIGTALVDRLNKNASRVLEGVDDERIQKAVLWGSEFRFWSSGYSRGLPSFFSNPTIQGHPVFMPPG